jgi:Flp pilus assembly protein TadG
MRSISSFLRNETGAVTIEFVTIVPAFIVLLVFFADASIIYLTRSEMWNVARDITRKMAIDEITTAAQARDYAAAHLFLGQRTYTIEPTFGGEMNVTIAVPVGEAAISGHLFQTVLGEWLVASVTMGREPLM